MSGECQPEFANAKSRSDNVGRSTLRRLKGKSCNGGNGGNYINAGNREVYTMIELHADGPLAGGQSASRAHRFEFFLCQLLRASSCNGISSFFSSHFCGTAGILVDLIFETDERNRFQISQLLSAQSFLTAQALR